MAITWTVSVTTIDVGRKTASVAAVRVDDILGLTETHTIATAILDTAAQKAAALDQLWQMHLDYQANETAIAAYIGGLEASAKTNLEARE